MEDFRKEDQVRRKVFHALQNSICKRNGRTEGISFVHSIFKNGWDGIEIQRVGNAQWVLTSGAVRVTMAFKTRIDGPDALELTRVMKHNAASVKALLRETKGAVNDWAANHVRDSLMDVLQQEQEAYANEELCWICKKPKSIKNQDGVHRCMVKCRFSCYTCGNRWGSGCAWIKPDTQEIKSQLCGQCGNSGTADSKWEPHEINHSKQMNTDVEKQHRSDLCQACREWGDCRSNFLQPNVVNGAIALACGARNMHWYADASDESIKTKLIYNGHENTVVIEPFVNVRYDYDEEYPQLNNQRQPAPQGSQQRIRSAPEHNRPSPYQQNSYQPPHDPYQPNYSANQSRPAQTYRETQTLVHQPFRGTPQSQQPYSGTSQSQVSMYRGTPQSHSSAQHYPGHASTQPYQGTSQSVSYAETPSPSRMVQYPPQSFNKGAYKSATPDTCSVVSHETARSDCYIGSNLSGTRAGSSRRKDRRRRRLQRSSSAASSDVSRNSDLKTLNVSTNGASSNQRTSPPGSAASVLSSEQPMEEVSLPPTRKWNETPTLDEETLKVHTKQTEINPLAGGSFSGDADPRIFVDRLEQLCRMHRKGDVSLETFERLKKSMLMA